jgi:hypothetical protein
MNDVESVSAFWLDCNLLYLECPFCSKIHYHCVNHFRRDIRESKLFAEGFIQETARQTAVLSTVLRTVPVGNQIRTYS